ncbi:MAG: nucleic acid-binding protein [Piscirickettsiaceae bacterium]|nr:MAG: nucleic acid-binding protein [Piscirickettsiaceae bacterium]PCI68786.1 MAG: nucleic acid-binding protein [Piscirickettsiaceae bacterium]
MNKTLQIEIDPYTCADQRRIFEGFISAANITRLEADVDSSTPDIKATLEFAREGKFIVLMGRIDGHLVLQCAACLEAVNFPIDIDFKLAIINDDSLTSLLPTGCEPKVYDGEKLLLSDIVEDELLLALPDIIRHEICPVELPHSSTSKDFVQEVDVKVNPFKVLEGFKND